MSSLPTHDVVCPVCGKTPTVPHANGTDFEYGTTPDVEWSLMRCAECDVVMLSPCPDESALSTLYPPSYYAYSFTVKKSLGYRVKGWLDRRTVETYLRYGTPESKILDVGCGDGRLLRMFAERGVARERLYGMELDEEAVERACGSGLQVSLGRLEDVEYEPEQFGLVLMQQVIEHVIDPRAVLEQVHEILAPEGAIILETPNTASWDHWLFSNRYWGGYHIPRHLFLFDRSSLPRLLETVGYRVVAVESLVSPSFWIQSFHHALAERSAPRPLLKFFDSHLPNPIALAAFTSLDVLGSHFGVTSNMRVIAEKI